MIFSGQSPSNYTIYISIVSKTFLFIIKLSKILRISRSLLFSRNKKIFFRRVGKGINAIKNGIREKNKVLLVTTITLSNASKQASK